MKIDKIKAILNELGIPYKHHHFTQKEMKDVELPFATWDTPEKTLFMADGKVYFSSWVVEIALYTNQRDWGLEERLEDLLNKNELVFEKPEAEWIKSENMWQTTYQMEV